MSDEQFDDSSAVPSEERAEDQFRRELDALRRKYEKLGLDFDAALEDHLVAEGKRHLNPTRPEPSGPPPTCREPVGRAVRAPAPCPSTPSTLDEPLTGANLDGARFDNPPHPDLVRTVVLISP